MGMVIEKKKHGNMEEGGKKGVLFPFLLSISVPAKNRYMHIGLLLSLVGGAWICTLIYFVLSGTIFGIDNNGCSCNLIKLRR